MSGGIVAAITKASTNMEVKPYIINDINKISIKQLKTFAKAGKNVQIVI